MKYMAPVLALLLSGSAQAQGIGDFSYFSWHFGSLPPIQSSEESETPGDYIVACDSDDATRFISASFEKGTVHGWIIAAIVSQDMRNGSSRQRESMSSCELDTYDNTLGHMIVREFDPDPKQPQKHYVILPPMPPTFFESSTHEEEENETSSYSSGNKG